MLVLKVSAILETGWGELNQGTRNFVQSHVSYAQTLSHHVQKREKKNYFTCVEDDGQEDTITQGIPNAFLT